MQQIADDVWLLDGWPRYYVNVYLVGGMVIDAGTRWAKRRVLRQLQGRKIEMLALTHVHPDHQGVARVVCQTFGATLACHQADVAAMEGREPMRPNNRLLRLGMAFWAGPPHPVGRVLRDGDEIEGFRVVHAPGHTPGHVLYFRERDRLCFAGDLLANINVVTGQPSLRVPPRFLCSRPEENRESLRRLLELKPRTLCFGHGPPLTNVDELQRYLERKLESPCPDAVPAIVTSGEATRVA